MAYVKRHPTNNLKRSIDYIKNEEKTDSLLTYEQHLPSSDTNEIVEMMNYTKRNFDKTDGIQGHHFIQSFKHDEDITLELAHQVGKEWSQKFIKDYEFVLATHKDKEHIHNHIIINSVNLVNGKKYLKNDKELHQIRSLSDEVCKTHNLSIIKPLEKEKGITKKGMSYGEWKYKKESISWKDKIKNDIDDSILQAENYEEFIEEMKKKDYELRYGKRYKYNSFEHFDIGKRIRGKTLGESYTEKAIQERIKNKELEEHKERLFFEEHYFVNGISNKEVANTDIDLSILQSTNYEEFINHMQDKNYELRYGKNYKYNSFKHKDMKRAVRGRTIGYDYTEMKIKERIKDNNELMQKAEYKEQIDLKTHVVFSKRYVSNKFKYIKRPQMNTMSEMKKREIQKKRQSLKYNQIIHFLKQNGITQMNEYIDFKKNTEQSFNSLVKYLNSIAEHHKKLMSKYNQQPSPELKIQIIENAKEHEKHIEKYNQLNKIRAEFKHVDKYLLDKEKQKEVKREEQTQDKEKEKTKRKGKDYGDPVR